MERTSQLEEANKELESFAYSVSHDLRAPLRAINGFAGIIQKDFAPQTSDQYKKYINIIHANALKMDHLITDLLTLSKTTITEMKKSKVDMKKMVDTILDEIKSTHGSAHYDISVSPLGEIMADPGLIQQVWVNLIDNAIKYSKRKESPVIQIGCHENNGNLVFFVKDNGVGFNQSYKDKLFTVFKRLHSSTDFEGTGIGLAIVDRIVRRHSGSVWAEGEEGVGSTFYFSLPIK
jgi:light-regulated signal transduction histidine kinase (bacteriophytochrome)